MKGENARKRGNKRDWWGKRPLSGTSVGSRGMKIYKKLLHKIERVQGKKQIQKSHP